MEPWVFDGFPRNTENRLVLEWWAWKLGIRTTAFTAAQVYEAGLTHKVQQSNAMDRRARLINGIRQAVTDAQDDDDDDDEV